MLNRMKIACIFAGGAAAGLMVAICANVWMGRPGSAGGEVLILPLIGLLLYVGYEFGYLSAMTEAARRRRIRAQKGDVRNG
ncbi:hypothetical protein WMO24_15645 [Ruthenibacterium sp. CLA-JM-H11]|uniref:Uncharacterized protein n=1 Tax=Ruthenibacterium intestinale TaxID=3133163 RepID=A0ABV1GJE1_9FIRM